jgi:hypothetical protein
MNAVGAIIYCLMMAAAPGAPFSRRVEIVVAGPEPGRGEMEAALRAALGTDIELTWSELDALPAADRLAPNQIWIDVTDSPRVRIAWPAVGSAPSPVIRTIDPAAAAISSDAESHEPVIRETVAQIVSATVRALRDTPAPRSGPLALAVPVIPAPASADLHRSLSIADRADRSVEPPLKRYSVAITAGKHTSPFSLGGSSDRSDWLGLSLAVSFRRETQRFIIEARAAAELSEHSLDLVDIHSQLYSATLAASRRLPAGPFTFSLGFETGALFLRETMSPGPFGFDQETVWTLAPYAPLFSEIKWSTGLLVGAIGQVSMPLPRRLFLHVTAGVPVVLMKVVNDGQWHASWYTQLLGGVGVSL